MRALYASLCWLSLFLSGAHNEATAAAPLRSQGDAPAHGVKAAGGGASASRAGVVAEGQMPYGIYSPLTLREGFGSSDDLLHELEGEAVLLQKANVRVYCIQPGLAEDVATLQANTDPGLFRLNKVQITDWEVERYFGTLPTSGRAQCTEGLIMVGPFASVNDAQTWQRSTKIMLELNRLKAYLSRPAVIRGDGGTSIRLELYVKTSGGVAAPKREEIERAGLPRFLQFHRPTITDIRTMTRDDAVERRDWFPGEALAAVGATIPGVFRVSTRVVVPDPEEQNQSRTAEVVVPIFVVKAGGAWHELTDGAGPGGTTEALVRDRKCRTPCRFLATVALDEVGDVYRRVCGGRWSPPGLGDCQQKDYLRNCIFATAGFPFRKEEWKSAFAAEPWYLERPGFKAADLTREGSQNVERLKVQPADCGTAGNAENRSTSSFVHARISKADLDVIVEWFRRRASQETWLPDNLKDDGGPSSSSEIRRILEQPGVFRLKPWTPFEYVKGREGEPREIRVDTGAPPPDCVPVSDSEDCEGFDWMLFTLDAYGRIVGLSIGAAG